MHTLPHARILALMLVLPVAAAAAQEIYVQPLHSVDAFHSTIRAGASTAADQLIAVASTDKSVKLFDLKTLSERATLTDLESPVTGLMFSRDGKFLLASKTTGQVTLWNALAKTKIREFSPHSSTIVVINVTQEGFVLTAGIDRVLRLSDAASGKELNSTSRFADDIVGIAPGSGGKAVVVALAGGQLRVLTLPQLKEAKSHDTQGRVTAMTMSSDGKFIALGGGDGSVRLWDFDNGLQVARFSGQKGLITSLSFTPKSRWLAVASTDSTLKIYDLASQTVVKSIPETKGYTSLAAFVDDEVLWTATTAGTLKTWRVLETPPDASPPSISITHPVLRNDAVTKVYAKEYQIQGAVEDENNVKEVTVNGTPAVITAADGGAPKSGSVRKFFNATVKLESVGINVFEVKATDQFGNTASERVQIHKLAADQAIEVLSPANNLETEKISVVLQFRTWCELGSYQVFVNLQEMVENKNLQNKKPGDAISEEIPLVGGYNQIQLVVISKSGEKFTKTLGVNKKILGPVVTSTAPKASPKDRGPGPQRWAVIVGVSEYGNPKIPSLKYADRDAQAFAEFLQKPEGGGYDADHLRILLNKNATLANLKEALIDFLAQAIDKDLVIIYFAGHGAPDPARPANLYLLTHDTDPARLGTTAFPMWQIQDVLSRYISAKRIVVFSDACHSGGISVDFAARGLGVTESNLINQYLADLSRTKEGTIVFTASAAGEVSQEFPELGHGAFTYYLLEGMKGQADFNNDYTVTINELMQYVEEQVKRKTKGAQNPTRSQTAYDKDLTISQIAH